MSKPKQSRYKPIMETTTGSIWVQSNPKENLRWYRDSGNIDIEYNVRFTKSSDVDKYLDAVPGEEPRRTRLGDVTLKRTTNGLRDIAVKRFEVRRSEGDIEGMIEAMNNEAMNIRKMNHFHIVEAIGSYATPTHAAFLMRPWAACNLSELLHWCNDPSQVELSEKFHALAIANGWGRIVKEFLPTLMGCLAHGLAYIHDQGVKHKDIKPKNILLHDARVMIADFDISREFDLNSTSASVGKKNHLATEKYAAPEAQGNTEDRRRSQDIFSLGCVFIEIFAVYKGRTVEEVRKLLKENPTSDAYSENISKVLGWVQSLVSESSDLRVHYLLQRMTCDEGKQRLWASEVWEELSSICSSSESYFCGACCMPQNPHLAGPPQAIPHPLRYKEERSSSSLRPQFETVYGDEETPPYTWKQNLRLGHSFILDSVQPVEQAELWCRKSVFRRLDSDAERGEIAKMDIKHLAFAEGRLLQRLPHHQHLVKLRATYRHGEETFVILTAPVAPFNLSEYLKLVEMKQDSSLYDAQEILRISPGCLASAVATLHQEGIAHGAISPENVLMDPHKDRGSKIFLANFGFAALNQHERSIRDDRFGRGKTEAQLIRNSPYTAPNLPLFEPIKKTDDIFSLGCVFLEMQTVRVGKKLQDMRKQLMPNYGHLDENHMPKLSYGTPSVMAELPRWIDTHLVPHGRDYAELIKSMVQSDATKRPEAQRVLASAAQIMVPGTNAPMCGVQCIP